MTFWRQWTGGWMMIVFAGLVLLDGISFLVFGTPVENATVLAITIGLLVLAWRRPSWVLPIALAEVIATSNGHALNIELLGASFGLRFLLFFLVCFVAIIVCLREPERLTRLRAWPSLLAVIVIVISATLLGWFASHDRLAWFLDANGYAALGYVVAALILVQTSDDRRKLLQGMAAGTCWIAIKTILLLFLFGHLHPKTLDPLYHWIRDTRLGEITLQRANIYRIFLQGQWFLLPAGFLAVAYILLTERAKETGVRVALMMVTSAVLISLSRSFWVAGAFGLFWLFLLALRQGAQVRQWVRVGVTLVTVVMTSTLFLWIVVALPVMQTVGTDVFGGLLRARATTMSDAAIDSRRQLLTPMLVAIKAAPFLGHGFGKQLTYTTDDPRWIETNGTDQVTTYAFEWGWLDLWIKMGIGGVLTMLWLLGMLVWHLHRAAKADPSRRWLYVGLSSAVVALAVTHVFTPYLNHPIGFALMAVIVAVLPQEQGRQEYSQQTHSFKRSAGPLIAVPLSSHLQTPDRSVP